MSVPAPDIPIVIYNPDGSFTVKGVMYLTELLCSIVGVHLDCADQIAERIKSGDFDVNNFIYKVTHENVTRVTVSTKDKGASRGKSSRSVTKRQLTRHGSSCYLRTKILNISPESGEVTCQVIGDVLDNALIQTNLSEFYRLGDATIESGREVVIASVNLMNKAMYNGSAGWTYDEEVNAVRRFDFFTNKIVDTLHPAEALQIAAKLGGGNWAGVKEPQVEQLDGKTEKALPAPQ
jgi:hypothetical protein